MLSLKARFPWGALAAEFVVVVAGILGALWVDEWREDRADAALEQVYLGRLEEDLAATSEALTPVVTRYENARDGIRATLALLDAPPGPATSDSLAKVVGWVGTLTSVEPVDAAYRELVQSGSLRVIRPSLRRQLALLDATAREMETQYTYEEAQYIHTVEPALVGGPLNYGRVAVVPQRMAAGGPPSDLRALWGDRRFWNVASLKLETVEAILEPARLPLYTRLLEETLAAVRAARKE